MKNWKTLLLGYFENSENHWLFKLSFKIRENKNIYFKDKLWKINLKDNFGNLIIYYFYVILKLKNVEIVTVLIKFLTLWSKDNSCGQNRSFRHNVVNFRFDRLSWNFQSIYFSFWKKFRLQLTYTTNWDTEFLSLEHHAWIEPVYLSSYSVENGHFEQVLRQKFQFWFFSLLF